MADTGADIMLVTEEFCTNMGLIIGPTALAIHTSVSGLGGLMGQVTQRFEIVLALGTKDELRAPVGPGTFIPTVGVAPSNPVNQVLLCQAFYHIAGGMVNPVIGRFTYLVNLWVYNDSSVIGTLEGVSSPSHEGPRTAHVTVKAKEESEGEEKLRTNQDKNPLPSPPARTAIKWVLVTC
jgi:hypothetical protein